MTQGGILYANIKRAVGLAKKPLYLGGSLPIIGSSHSRVKVRLRLGSCIPGLHVTFILDSHPNCSSKPPARAWLQPHPDFSPN